MKLKVAALVCAGIFLFAGCKKKSEEQKAAEKLAEVMQKAAEASSRVGAEGSADPAQNPAAAMAEVVKATQAVAEAGGKKFGEVVNWRKLAPYVPEKLGDFQSKGDLDGSTQTIGKMKVSHVSRRFVANKQELTVKISDTSLVPMLRAGFAMARTVSKDSTSGVQRGVEVSGSPGMLEWRKSSKRGKVVILVGGRYMVEVRLRPTEDPDAALNAAKLLNLKGLAAVTADK